MDIATTRSNRPSGPIWWKSWGYHCECNPLESPAAETPWGLRPLGFWPWNFFRDCIHNDTPKAFPHIGPLLYSCTLHYWVTARFFVNCILYCIYSLFTLSTLWLSVLLRAPASQGVRLLPLVGQMYLWDEVHLQGIDWLDQTRPDQTGPNWTGPDRTGPDRTGPDRTGPDRTGPDRTRPDQTRPDQCKINQNKDKIRTKKKINRFEPILYFSNQYQTKVQNTASW